MEKVYSQFGPFVADSASRPLARRPPVPRRSPCRCYRRAEGRRLRRRAAPRDNRVANWQTADTDDVARVRRSTSDDADGANDDDADDGG